MNIEIDSCQQCGHMIESPGFCSPKCYDKWCWDTQTSASNIREIQEKHLIELEEDRLLEEKINEESYIMEGGDYDGKE